MAESNYENARWKDLNLDLILTLKREPGVPLYAVLAEAVKQSMLEHELNSGDPLPSARELAKQYHLSTSTALRAYEVLSSQGYVETSPKSATRVSNKFVVQSKNISQPEGETTSMPLREPELSAYAQRLLSSGDTTAAPQEAGISIPGACFLVPSGNDCSPNIRIATVTKERFTIIRQILSVMHLCDRQLPITSSVPGAFIVHSIR
jgi:DNA-binding transcriptional regulator YhcF (GntR family)